MLDDRLTRRTDLDVIRSDDVAGIESRLRSSGYPRCRRVLPPRHDPPHAQTPDEAKPLITYPSFLDQLLQF